MILRYCSSSVSIAALGGQLLDLALGDDGRGVAEDLQHLQAAVLDHQLEGAAEQEIADQYASPDCPR